MRNMAIKRSMQLKKKCIPSLRPTRPLSTGLGLSWMWTWPREKRRLSLQIRLPTILEETGEEELAEAAVAALSPLTPLTRASTTTATTTFSAIIIIITTTTTTTTATTETNPPFIALFAVKADIWRITVILEITGMIPKVRLEVEGVSLARSNHQNFTL